MTDHQCATCSTAFIGEDVVHLNGTPEQVRAMQDRLDARKAVKKLKSAVKNVSGKSKSKALQIDRAPKERPQETACKS